MAKTCKKDVAVFSDTITVINVRLCMMVIIKLYLLIPLSVTLNIFYDHSRVKQFKLKFLCSYLIKLKFLCSYVIQLKLCRIFKYGKHGFAF